MTMAFMIIWSYPVTLTWIGININQEKYSFLSDSLAMLSLESVPFQPTCYINESHTTTDYICNLDTSCIIHPELSGVWNISEHDALILNLLLPVYGIAHEFVYSRDFKTFDLALFRKSLSQVSWDDVVATSHVHSKVLKFTSKFSNILDESVNASSQHVRGLGLYRKLLPYRPNEIEAGAPADDKTINPKK